MFSNVFKLIGLALSITGGITVLGGSLYANVKYTVPLLEVTYVSTPVLILIGLCYLFFLKSQG